jgi:hypothetical protein
MTDIEVLVSMLVRANIQFTVDKGCGWTQRILIEGDRCFVFDTAGGLAGIRNHDDTSSFDGN